MAGCAGPWEGVGNAEAMTLVPWAVASSSFRVNSGSPAYTSEDGSTAIRKMWASVPSKPAQRPLCPALYGIRTLRPEICLPRPRMRRGWGMWVQEADGEGSPQIEGGGE